MTNNKKNSNPPKGNMHLHIFLGITILVIIGFIAFRLIEWNNNRVVVSSDDDGSSEMECMDYYVHPSEEQKTLRNADGRKHILVIGNKILNQSSDGSTSVIEQLEDMVDADFTTLIADYSLITAQDWPVPATVEDTFNLNNIVSVLCNDDVELSSFHSQYFDQAFSSHEAREEYFSTLYSVDLNTIDTVLISYDLADYFSGLPHIAGDKDNVRGLYGSIYCSVAELINNYPHLEIFIASPTPAYLMLDNELKLSAEFDVGGHGNSSLYVVSQYNTALELFVSYIDNYYYVIDEDNITEYVNGIRLTPKGVKSIATHIAEYLNKQN